MSNQSGGWFALLAAACFSAVAVGQDGFGLDGYWLGEAAKATARTNSESTERIVFMIVVGAVIAAALIAGAIFFRRREPPNKGK